MTGLIKLVIKPSIKYMLNTSSVDQMKKLKKHYASM